MNTLHQPTTAYPPSASTLKKLTFGILIAAVVLFTAAFAVTLGMRALSAQQPAHPIYIQDMEPHPFGPGWAADYGTFQADPPVSNVASPDAK